jgi:flagellar motility protein MotE (MotC chaperone)
MRRLLRDVRLIPIVLVATISLFALKVSGLVFDGGYTLAERMDHNKNDLKIVPADSVPDFPKIVLADGGNAPQAPGPKQPWAKEMFNFGGSSSDITGSVDKDKEADKEKPAEKDKKAEGEKEPEGEKKDGKAVAPSLPLSNKPPGATKVDVGDVSVHIEQGHIVSAGERAVLERLRDRNQELDARNRELDMRENLIKVAEKRLEAKVTELKDTEVRVNTAMGNRDKAEAARLNGIVAMYENMKPKDAARIFDRLDLNILVDVTTKINPRKMSDILAQMSPDAAERLTVELAHRAGAVQKPQGVDQLPKIESKPSQP